MSKRPLGRCVHCLQPDAELTDDHVFPLSWFPDNAPLEIERWTAPACSPCNRALGAVEQELLLRICLCIDPDASGTQGLAQRALRALDPREGKSPRDQRIRARLLEKMWGQSRVGLHGSQVLAPFHERWGRPPEEQRAINVPQHLMRQFGEKMARGIHYMLDGAYIEPQSVIRVFPTPEVSEEIAQVMRDRGSVHRIGSVVVVNRFASGAYSACSIEIWSLLTIWVTVSPQDVMGV